MAILTKFKPKYETMTEIIKASILSGNIHKSNFKKYIYNIKTEVDME